MRNSAANIGWIDAKILKALLKNGRDNFTTIAKEIGVSKTVVWKHYKKMRKNGIIRGFTTQMDYPSLGYKFVADMQITSQYENIEAIVEYLRHLPNTYGVWSTATQTRISAVLLVKNSSELDLIKNSVKGRWPILEIVINIWTSFVETIDNLSALSFQKDSCEADGSDSEPSSANMEPYKVDKTDLEIIDMLNRNGDISFRKIAEEMKMSTNKIIRRYHKLTNEGILRVVVQIDPTKLGYCAIGYFNVITTHGLTPSNTEKILLKIPDVFATFRTTGKYDFKAFALINSMNQLLDIQETLGKINGVIRVDLDLGKINEKWPACAEILPKGVAWPCRGHQITTPPHSVR